MRSHLSRTIISRHISPKLRCLFSSGSIVSKSHYETLGVSTSASKGEIRAGYISNSKLYHPDHDSSDPTLHEKFLAIQEAYDVLSCDVKRKEYDIGNIHRRSSHSSSRYHHNKKAPLWSEDRSHGREEKNRAFWTDPTYPKMKPTTATGKWRLFGREFDRRETNRLIATLVIVWMTLGTAFVYFYVKYFFGRRQATLTDSQRRILEQYEATKVEAKSKTHEEAVEDMKKRLHVVAKYGGEKRED